MRNKKLLLFIDNRNDDNLINLMYNESGKVIGLCTSDKWIDKQTEVKEYLTNRFLLKSNSYKETIYRIKYGLSEIPICPVCKTHYRKFNNLVDGYYLNCSKECAYKSEHRANSFYNTYKDRYGNLTKDELKLMYNYTEDIQEKRVQTCIERYGVDNIMKLKTTVDKVKNTCILRYGVDNPNKLLPVKDKIKNTSILKYGVDNPAKAELIKNKLMQGTSIAREKRMQTCMERYGVDNPMKTDIILNIFFLY